MLLRGDVSAFDVAAQAQFGTRMASMFVGIGSTDVNLVVVARTLRRRLQGNIFEVHVSIQQLADVAAAAHVLTHRSIADLSTTLGVEVVSVSAPSVSDVVVSARSPPPIPTTPPAKTVKAAPKF